MRLDISSYDIDNLKPITNGRHRGNFGTCYLFYGDAIKIIDVDKDVIKKIDIEKRLEEVSKVKVEGVSLPKRLVYVNNKFTGYTKPYYNAPNLKVILMKYKQGKLSITSNDINNAYTSILNKIDVLSYYKIIVNDIKPDNIIYLDGDFKLVDCDFYRVDTSLTYSDSLKKNKEILNHAYEKIINEYFECKTYNDNDIINTSLRM